MSVWILLIIYLVGLKGVMGRLKTKNQQRNYLILASLGIIFVMGCRYPRYEIVYDLRTYYNFYREAGMFSLEFLMESSRFEIGFIIFNKLIATIIPWPQFILIIEAIICVTGVAYFIYKNSEEPFLPMLFYVTLGTMTFQLTAFRQAIAMSICLISIEMIKKKKLNKFIMLILIAMSFHKSAIIFIPFYFIANRKLSLSNNFKAILIIAVGTIFTPIIVQIGNELMGMNYNGYKGSILGGLVPICIYAFTIGLSMMNWQKVKNPIFINMTILGFGIYLMRYTTLEMERIAFYYTIGTIIALPYIINTRKDAKILRLLAIILAITLFIYRCITSEWGVYRFFWA